jgi:hypothetical protein
MQKYLIFNLRPAKTIRSIRLIRLASENADLEKLDLSLLLLIFWLEPI